MPWTPATSLLGTVREFTNFSHSIQYYEETPGEPTTGVDGTVTPGEAVRTYYPVTITQVTPQSTISTAVGDPATLTGYYKYIFYDTIIYRDFNENIKTLQGSGDMGTWEQFNIDDCYQMVEFIPDSTRFRTFHFTAEAKNTNGSVRATSDYTIDVSDQSWDSGAAALHNVITQIRAKGR